MVGVNNDVYCSFKLKADIITRKRRTAFAARLYR